MSFESYLQARIREIDSAIDRWLPKTEEYPEVLVEAMRYSLFAKGKRLRPILLLATAEALDAFREEFLPAACAVEMIHTYSLIHDDLPAMDNDDLRRGIPTNHKVYGEANAILAGDAILTEAFYLLSVMPLPGRDATKIELIRELSAAAGYRGMIRGQVADILNEGKQASEEMVYLIHANKTGAMLQASVRMGAILGQATDRQLNALTDYATKLGLAFQIVDDILDIVGDTAVMGKTAGSDQSANKSTFVSLFGLEASKEKAQELIKMAHRDLDEADLRDSTRLSQLADFVVERVW